MNLLPPPSDLTAPINTLLISLIQAHTLKENYAIVKKRFTKDKKKKILKIHIRSKNKEKIFDTIKKKKNHRTRIRTLEYHF